MVERDRELNTSIVGEGGTKGTVITGYQCRCGRMILGRLTAGKRGLARCVVCERVVVRKHFRAAFGEGLSTGMRNLEEVGDEEGEGDEDEDADGDGDVTWNGDAGNAIGENAKGTVQYKY